MKKLALLLIASLLFAGCFSPAPQKPSDLVIESPATGADENPALCISFPTDTAPIDFKGNKLIYADGYAQHWANRSLYYMVIRLSNASVNLPCSSARVNAQFSKGSLHSIRCYPLVSEKIETRLMGQEPELIGENDEVIKNATDIFWNFTNYCGSSPMARVNTANSTGYIVEIEGDLWGIKSIGLNFGGVSLG